MAPLHDGGTAHVVGAMLSFFGGGGAWRYASLAVRTMPTPLKTDSRWYNWLYDFLQSAFANPDKKVSN